MTQSVAGSQAEERDWPTATDVGELTLAAWPLAQAVRRIAQGLGVDADRVDSSGAIAIVKDRLEHDGLPRWTRPSVSVQDFLGWLGDTELCVAEVETAISATARAQGDRQPFTATQPATMRADISPGGQLNYRWLVADSLAELAARCRELSRRGDDRTESLGLPTEGGSTQFGYHHIARLLYDVATGAGTSAEMLAELKPKARARRSA